MSTSFHLCTADDLTALSNLMARRQEEAGQDPDAERIAAGLAPLLDASADGAAYVFGPPKAPVGYLALTFNWSLPLAARQAEIADLYIRPNVRRRGLATEAVHTVTTALRTAGIAAMGFEAPADNEAMVRLARRLGYARAEGINRMERRL